MSGFNFADDARSLALVDWDHDGDLDIWVTNRTAPRVRFLRNDAASGNRFVAVRLEGRTCNRDAIGARVELHLAKGPTLIRTLRAGEGFLGQSSKWLHFGLGRQAKIKQVVVRWPGGQAETFTGFKPDHWYQLQQSSGTARVWTPPARSVQLAAASVKVPAESGKAAVLLSSRVPLPALEYQTFDGTPSSLAKHQGKAVLVNLWATWCAPCVVELQELARHQQQLDAAGVNVVALSVDALGENGVSDPSGPANLLEKIAFPFAGGMASPALHEKLQVVFNQLFIPRPLPVPTSVLIDAEGRLAAIYLGPVTIDRLLRDVATLKLTDQELLAASLPFDGRWFARPDVEPRLLPIVHDLLQRGYLDEMLDYVPRNRERLSRDRDFASLLTEMGTKLAEQGKLQAAASYCRQALKLDPQIARAYLNLGVVLVRQGRLAEALVPLRQSVKVNPKYAQAQMNLGTVLMQLGRQAEAVGPLEKAVRWTPDPWLAHLKLATVLEQQSKNGKAAEHYRQAAWIMATRLPPNPRRATQAVEVAEHAAKRTPRDNVAVLDTLAAAYASAGRFDKAVSTAKAALKLAERTNQTHWLEPIQQRLETYKLGKPYRER